MGLPTILAHGDGTVQVISDKPGASSPNPAYNTSYPIYSTTTSPTTGWVTFWPEPSPVDLF